MSVSGSKNSWQVSTSCFLSPPAKKLWASAWRNRNREAGEGAAGKGGVDPRGRGCRWKARGDGAHHRMPSRSHACPADILQLWVRGGLLFPQKQENSSPLQRAEPPRHGAHAPHNANVQAWGRTHSSHAHKRILSWPPSPLYLQFFPPPRRLFMSSHAILLFDHFFCLLNVPSCPNSS